MTMRDRWVVLVVTLASLAITIPAAILASFLGMPWGLIPGVIGVWGGAEVAIWLINRDQVWTSKR